MKHQNPELDANKRELQLILQQDVHGEKTVYPSACIHTYTFKLLQLPANFAHSTRQALVYAYAVTRGHASSSGCHGDHAAVALLGKTTEHSSGDERSCELFV